MSSKKAPILSVKVSSSVKFTFAALAGVSAGYFLWKWTSGEDRSPLKKARKKKNVPGLVNVGNSCFMNVLLQAFASCPSYIHWLEEFIIETKTDKDHIYLASILLKILKILDGDVEIDNYYFDPSELLEDMGGRGWQISSQEQDSHEFYHALMTTLIEEYQHYMWKRTRPLGLFEMEELLSRPPMFSTQESKKFSSGIAADHPSNLHNPSFRGTLACVLQCHVCGYQHPIRYDGFDSLSLSLPSGLPWTSETTLMDCLRGFMASELVHDVECENCSRIESEEILKSHDEASITINKSKVAAPGIQPIVQEKKLPKESPPLTNQIQKSSPANPVSMSSRATKDGDPTTDITTQPTPLPHHTSSDSTTHCDETSPVHGDVTGVNPPPNSIPIQESPPADHGTMYSPLTLSEVPSDGDSITDINPKPTFLAHQTFLDRKLHCDESPPEIQGVIFGVNLSGNPIPLQTVNNNIKFPEINIENNPEQCKNVEKSDHSKTEVVKVTTSDKRSPDFPTKMLQNDAQTCSSESTIFSADFLIRKSDLCSLAPHSGANTLDLLTQSEAENLPVDASELNTSVDILTPSAGEQIEKGPTSAADGDDYNPSQGQVSMAKTVTQTPKKQFPKTPFPPLSLTSQRESFDRYFRRRFKGEAPTKIQKLVTVRQTFHRRLTLGKLPQCLCMHIQRLVWTRGTPMKKMNFVKFPEILDVGSLTELSRCQNSSKRQNPKSSFTDEIKNLKPAEMQKLLLMRKALRSNTGGSAQQDRPPLSLHGGSQKELKLALSGPQPPKSLYRLMAVVVHIGDWSFSGHFLAYRRSPEGSEKETSSGWLFTSDTMVRRASKEEVFSCPAYMLFYERIKI